ncbi:MAG: DUF211 domain-containing protein [Pseudomonadales bacterium]
MAMIKHVVLDVLKPHLPNTLDFALALADQLADSRVEVTVIEIDEQTDSLEVRIDSRAIDFDAVAEVITGLGASIHSVDKVAVVSDGFIPASE